MSANFPKELLSLLQWHAKFIPTERWLSGLKHVFAKDA